MSTRFEETPAALAQPVQAQEGAGLQEWDLDVSIVESGPAADRLIRMTDDGCGQTCESACSTTCP